MATIKILGVVLLLVSSFTLVSGQSQTQYDRGTPPQLAAGVSSFGSYTSTELGTVNLTNGGLNFNIPLGTIGGRGNVALPLTLSYSSKVWSATRDVDTERESQTEQPVAFADYDNHSSFGGATAPGWTLRAGISLSSRFVKIQRVMSGPNEGCYSYGLSKLTLNLPDKGEIEFRDDATDGAPLPLNCSTQQTASRGTRWHATDGSGAIYINDVDNGVGLFPVPNLSGTIILADGTRLGSTTSGAIVDRNGNQITQTVNGYRDQLGREITIQYSVNDPQNPSEILPVLITVPGYQGAPRYYKIKFGIMNQNYRSDINPTLPVITGDWDPEGWGYGWGTATRLYTKSYGLYAQQIDDREVLTEVVLPDGRSLKFRYNEFGEVAEVELPTGAKIQYDYGYDSGLPSGNSPTWETQSSGLDRAGISTDVKFVDRAVKVKRTYPDGVNLEGTWTFGYGLTTIGATTYPATTVIVTSNTSELLAKQRHIFLQPGRYTEAYNGPSVHDGTHYTLWSTGLEWRTESLDAAGNVLAATEQSWTQRAPVSWSSYPQEQPAKDNRVYQARKYLETGLMSKVDTVYDQYNNPIEVWEYDYNQALKRRTVTTYLGLNAGNGLNYQSNDAIHMLRLPETQTVYDGGGNQRARTITEYDLYTNDGNHNALTGYSSVSQHDSNYGLSKTTRGNPTRIGTWLNTTDTYIYSYPRYDVLGNVVSIKDARGNVSTISFADDFGDGSNPGTSTQNPATPTYALPTLITSPPPTVGAPVHTARSQYDYASGLLTGFRDRNNVVTQTIYNDPFNRPTQVNSALGISGVQNRTVIYYAPAVTPFGITLARNDVLTAKDQTVLNDGALRSWSVTDGFGRTKESWSRDPQGDVKVVTIYDGLGRAKQVSNPFRPSVGETAVYSTTNYDLLGRVTTVSTPDTATVTTTYNANTVTVTDQAGKARKSVTDALGRLIEVYEDPNGSNYQTKYTYDTLDNLVKVEQGSQQRFFMYDSLKRLLRADNPEQQTLSSLSVTDPVTNHSSWSVKYVYDDNGNLTSRTDARGVETQNSYDALNRVAAILYRVNGQPDPNTGDIEFLYDNATYGKGRLWLTYRWGVKPSHTAVGSYDAMGRVKQLYNLFGDGQGGWSAGYEVSRNYNLAGAVTSQTYPSGRTVNYFYDLAGRTSSFSGNLGDGTPRTYATGINYGPWGTLTREQFGTNSAVYNKLHYNIRGQLCDVRASNVNDEWSGELGALVNYFSANGVQCGSGSDNNGNVRKSQTIVNGSYYMEDRYDYDSLNRLTSVSEYQNGATPTGTQQYDYDRWGNRTIKSVSTLGTNYQFTVNTATNRLGVPAGDTQHEMTYDNAGNLTRDTYTGAGDRVYDGDNHIVAAQDTLSGWSYYTYNANGQRVRRKVNNQETWQIYGIDGELVAEYPANGAAGTPQKEYGYRNGQLLITAEAAVPQNVSWTNTAGVSVNGNSLTKTAATGWGNSGASSTQSITSGDGYVEVTATETSTARLFGLSHTDADQNWTTIDFGIDLDLSGSIYVFESGNNRGNFGSYATGDKFQVAIVGGVVKYKKNGTVFYTSSVTPTYPLVVDTSLHGNASTLSNVVLAAPRWQWLVTDHLGTPRLIIDQAGAVANVKRHDYLPFGEELFATTGGRTTGMGYVAGDNIRQQFTSKERDSETSLDYFLARYYSATQGRFTSTDEFSGGPSELYSFVQNAAANPTSYADLSNPQSLNKYQYGFNNPLRYVDPDGHDPEEPEPQDPKPAVPVPAPVPGPFPPVLVPFGSPTSGPTDQQILDGIRKIWELPDPYLYPISQTIGTAPDPTTAPVPVPPLVVPAPKPQAQPLAPPAPILSRSKNTQKVINGLIATAVTHVAKINSSDPNDPNRNHWKKEIQAALNRAQRLAQRLKGKAQEAVKQKIKDLRGQIE